MLEIEKKFLIKFPSSWSDIAKLLDCATDILRINQSYLLPKGDEPAVRVRETKSGLSGDIKTAYHYNKKKPTKDTGTHKEIEFELSKTDYNRYLKQSDPKKNALEKIRFVFKFEDQLFELDLFKGPLKGLAILEIELVNKNDTIILPPFLKVLKEVTENKVYNNFSLADKR